MNITPLRRQSRTYIAWEKPACWLIILLVILLPLERIVGPMNTVPADAALIGLLVYAWPMFFRHGTRLHFPLLLAMWLIFIASVTATFFSMTLMTNIIALIQEFYIYAWFITLTNLFVALGRKRIDQINRVFILITCIESLLTLMGMFRIGPRFLHRLGDARYDFRWEGVGRALGTFNNANAAGAYLVNGFFILLATPFFSEGFLQHLIRWGSAGWILLGIYATGSNGSLGGLAVGMGFLALTYIFVYSPRHVHKLWVSLGLIAAGLLTSIPLVGLSILSLLQQGAGGDFFTTTLGRLTGGLEKRQMIWGDTWNAISQYPLGIGPNSSSEVLGGSLHNDYIAFLTERGPVGLIGLLLLCTLSLLCVFATVRLAPKVLASAQTRARQFSALALGAAFVANMVNAMAHEVTHSRSLWFLMALIFAYYYILQERASRTLRVDPGSKSLAQAEKCPFG